MVQEVYMKKNKLNSGIIVLVVIIGLTMATCEDNYDLAKVEIKNNASNSITVDAVSSATGKVFTPQHAEINTDASIVFESAVKGPPNKSFGVKIVYNDEGKIKEFTAKYGATVILTFTDDDI
jgi:hypothetical protein